MAPATAMLTPNKSPTVPQATAADSPVEYVRSLSPEGKQAVLLELVREMIQMNGSRGLIPVEDEAGASLGYFVPPEAADEIAAKRLPTISDEQREITRRALATPDQTFDVIEFLEECRREDEARVR